MSRSLAKTESKDSLASLLLPLSDRFLLLPNSVIAELIPYCSPQSAEGLPPWVLGLVSWRELRLPLLSFEAASGGAHEVGAAARIAVINALGGRTDVKFLALLVQGIPHSVRIDAGLPRTEAELAPLELEAVTVGNIPARIPDLIGLEQKLVDAGLI